ncbi:hypothetical protein NDU88_008936 [Pleurodeles waltl]|uniref:Uncharacterized protein n=1 Tax=Pleurodeles waltl TaxID=8319 RepID=A0AAV7QW28_PLEWA|nr:hypothetical protein NDU88_008936 [Pleurodeles waltl]
MLCTAIPAPTSAVPRTEAWRHREDEPGDRELATRHDPLPTERAWLEGRSHITGGPRTVWRQRRETDCKLRGLRGVAHTWYLDLPDFNGEIC